MEGNQQKMREALRMVKRYLQWLYAQVCTDRVRLSDEIDRIISAISTPARQCDVGTAEEQAERFAKHCDRFYRCNGCPCCGKKKYNRCEFIWAQMPYAQEGGAK